MVEVPKNGTTAQVKEVLVSSLRPNPGNPRKISEAQKAKLRKSLEDFPEMLSLRPLIVTPEGIILAGNMRFLALQEMGIERIPVIEADLPKAKQRELVVKDNLSFGEWDWSLVLLEWAPGELDRWGMEDENLLALLQRQETISDSADELDNGNGSAGLVEAAVYCLPGQTVRLKEILDSAKQELPGMGYRGLGRSL